MIVFILFYYDAILAASIVVVLHIALELNSTFLEVLFLYLSQSELILSWVKTNKCPYLEIVITPI